MQTKITNIFICWPTQLNFTGVNLSMTSQSNLHLMYLKLENHKKMAYFYSCSNPKSSEFKFKYNPFCCPQRYGSLCFEADLTKPIRSFFKQYDIDIYETESKIYFRLEHDGTIGWVLYFHNRLCHIA